MVVGLWSASAAVRAEDVPVPGGVAALAKILDVEPAPDRARAVAEFARLLYTAPEQAGAEIAGRLKRVQAQARALRQTRARPVTAVAARQNAVQDAAQVAASDRVPVPFSPSFWSSAVFNRPVADSELVAAILSDRNAALLCHGLMGVEPATLLFLNQHPQIVTDLYRSRAAAFAASGPALVIRDGRVVVPGGREGVELWQAVVGEVVTRPDRFVRELFGRDDGRLAFLYDTISRLDPPRRAFALGTWIRDVPRRRERFEALVRASHDSLKDWVVDRRPFARTPNDVALLLSTIRVHDDGSPMTPAARRFWSRALEGVDLPGDPERLLRNVDEDGPIDAAWLVQQLATAPIPQRQMPFAAFEFGQRVFGDSSPAQFQDVLVAIRGVSAFPVLMHALASAGVRTPHVYASAARRAASLGELDGDHLFVAIRQFQGAIAAIVRTMQVGNVTAEQGEALIGSLSEVEPSRDGYYAALLPWLQARVGEALGISGPLTDTELLTAVSGRIDPNPPVITWEEHRYRVDLASADLEHSLRARELIGGVHIESTLQLDELRRRLSDGALAIGDAAEISAALKNLASSFAPIRQTRSERPPGVDEPPNLQAAIEEAAADVSRITRAADLRDAPRIAERLTGTVDAALAEAFTALAYAAALGQADPTVVPGAATIPFRHDFGFGEPGDVRQRTMWSEPHKQVASGQPWRIKGALLGLDVALVDLTLRRQVSDGIEMPTISANDVQTFKRSYALLNPYRMRDTDRAEIVAAIARGRERVEKTANDMGFAALADEIGMDGWRRSAVSWAMANEPDRVPSYFSLEELLALGHVAAGVDLDAWGMASAMTGGCLCTSLDGRSSWRTVVGRDQLGQLPSEVPDLHLSVAMQMAALDVPASLTKAVLASITEHVVDQIRQTDPGDWLALVRAGQQVTRETVEDAVASLSGDGPLMSLEESDAER